MASHWGDQLDRIKSEMQVVRGRVPSAITDVVYREGDSLVLSGTELLFTTLGGVQYHYRRGHGVTMHVPDPALEDEAELYLWGTVFGAIAWLNGYMPLHASAVSLQGRVIAFTADSGGGKSTLAASLASRGLLHVCDDTLVVSATADGLLALPDAKPIKLWEDALALAGEVAERPIGFVPGKYYVRPRHIESAPGLLTDLVFLEWGDDFAFEPITGAMKLKLVPDAMYRGFIHVGMGDRLIHETYMMNIAANVRFWRLCRPKRVIDFDKFIDRILEKLQELRAT